jgi:putative transposase
MDYTPGVPSHLKRYQNFGSYHFITFSCYRRLALLNSEPAKQTFEAQLERVRKWYGFFVFDYVVMPEHVHLLVSEPPEDHLRAVIQMLKQHVSRKLPHGKAFWEPRYHDFNVITERKWREKLRYLHRNPVARVLVEAPEQWPWSSFRHYLTGEIGTVEIESEWMFKLREKNGVTPNLGLLPPWVSHPKFKKRPS